MGGDNREITKEAAAVLFDLGFAGVTFRSKLDGRPCHALFEGRGALELAGAIEPLCDDLPELLTACTELDLIPEPCS